MLSANRIFLIGPMGAGKSAVGRQLARLLKLEFVDSDTEIERRTGVDVAFIFEKEGEAGFRQREQRIIEELTERDGIVLATGGGVVLNEDNRRHLGSRGFVVYLETSVAQQLSRTEKGRHRPLLENEDPGAVLAALFEHREPLYLDVADLVVSTDKRKVHAVAEEIAQHLGREGDGGMR